MEITFFWNLGTLVDVVGSRLITFEQFLRNFQLNEVEKSPRDLRNTTSGEVALLCTLSLGSEPGT